MCAVIMKTPKCIKTGNTRLHQILFISAAMPRRVVSIRYEVEWEALEGLIAFSLCGQKHPVSFRKRPRKQAPHSITRVLSKLRKATVGEIVAEFERRKKCRSTTSTRTRT